MDWAKGFLGFFVCSPVHLLIQLRFYLYISVGYKTLNLRIVE